MKLILILVTSIVLMQCSSKNYYYKENNSDTLFVNKEKYPYLFYEPNPESKYKLFNDLTIQKFCSEYDTILDSKWIHLERFNNKYVFFLQTEFSDPNKYLFCGSYFYEILSSGDNPLPRKIESKKRISSTEYLYILDLNQVIHIYIIDEQRGIAILHDSKNGYKFITKQKLSYDIPVLSNYNKNTMVLDYIPFDEVDFQYILKQSGFDINNILND